MTSFCLELIKINNDIFDLIFPKTYICSWSGGKDSIASIILAHENSEPLDKIVMSEVMYDKTRNISGELPEHINWAYNIAIPRFQEWGYQVEIVKSEKDYLDLFYGVCKRSKYIERIGKYHGFVVGGKCAANRDLKIKPITDYYKKMNIADVIQYVGIAIDEPKRLKRLNGTNKVSLLEKYKFTEQQAYELCKKYNLLSPSYEFTKRGGCWFCPNQTNEELAHLKKYHPELWEELKILSKEKNLVSYGFKYGKTIEQVENKINKILEGR